MDETTPPANSATDRQSIDVDIACVGFGPAMGGFLTTLARELIRDDGTPAGESSVMPGLPPQIVCYERAADVSFGVSGVATRSRALRASLTEADLAQIPMATPIKSEKVLYLLDPHGASRRSWLLRAADVFIRAFRRVLPFAHDALNLPYIPPFLRKDPGWILSMGQFNQWVGSRVMSSGLVQIWPGTPVAEPLFEDNRVAGVRLVDQGTDKQGRADAGFMPGMDIRAALTVVGDGPFGPIGRQLDQRFGMPEGHRQHDWAVGMKFVVDLREDSGLEPGAVIHTFGYPEPEIFGFLYVHPKRIASLGVFVPSWFDSPVRTAYRYLQHWMLHPYLFRHLEGATLRSWGAKTLGESGRRGEPRLVGHGYARVGEGSGSTNVLTGSGVDEAWETGVLLAHGVLDLLRAGRPFTKENLEEVYIRRRRRSWIEREGRIAEKSRDGFQRGFVSGVIGMALAGFTKGRVVIPGEPAPSHERLPAIEEYFKGRVSSEEIRSIREDCAARGVSLHDALMDRVGWPAIPFDGKLLVTHQDALLLGGKVQAPAGYADHVVFLYPHLCESCGTRICIEMCSGQAITPGPRGVPYFDREKCVHCGACVWNCAQAHPDDPARANIEFRAGTGGLHSSEN
ncbi:MAG: 4Fe-4S ferredoxin [Vicinamibacteria bacterium]|nr:4Fe-4S ferredoxin [Vicinamibacteria bacterium]